MASRHMQRLEKLVAELAEAERMDDEEWGDHPTFRVRNKNFVFASEDATDLSFKLPKEEAIAVVASDSHAFEMGYGLGRNGWVSYDLPRNVDADKWEEVRRWVRTSYTLVAPKKLARIVLDEDGIAD